MTRSSSRSRRARTALAAAVLTGALACGASGVAAAEPSLVPTPTPRPTVAVEGGAAATPKVAAAAAPDVLDTLAEQYAVGAGGGQLSNLLKVALKLRAMGFRPSKPYLDEIQTAMGYRPNQLPLIDALKDTIAYQQKLRAQMELLTKAQARQSTGSAVMGAGQMPAAGNPANPAPPPPAAPPVPPLTPPSP